MPITFTPFDRRVTGLSGVVGGVVGGVVSVLMVGLYFIYSGPPPPENVLIRTLISLVAFTAFLIFATGLSRMLRADGHGDAGLAGSIAINAFLTYISITPVSIALEAGTSLWFPDGSLDPTVDGPLSAATVLLHGPIARFLVATFLIALAIATRRTFVTWVRRGSIALALINVALVPSLFFGMNAAFFYAANGWVSTATIGLVNTVWLGIIGRAVLKGANTVPEMTPSVPTDRRESAATRG